MKITKMNARRIQTQRDLTPRSLILACAEGLLGDLIKNARLGFSDLATEDPLHHTVQLIAAARGFHHHHEYPVVKTKGRGDHKRLDFVFAKASTAGGEGKSRLTIDQAIAVEMKVLGRSSNNNTKPWLEPDLNDSIWKRCRDVSADMKKIHSFMTINSPQLGIRSVSGFLLVVNLGADAGIRWDIQKSGGIRQRDVALVQRFSYSSGQVNKSVTVYEVHVRP